MGVAFILCFIQFWQNVELKLINMSCFDCDLCSVKYSLMEAGVKSKEGEKEKDICNHRTINIHMRGWQILYMCCKKNWRERNPERETGRERREPVLYHLTGDLSSAIRWRRQNDQSHTHTHRHAFSLCLRLPLFPLVSIQSRDQPLADRTGPLGSCYRPPQRRDWKALIAALRSPQSWEKSLHISHWILYLRQKEEREGGSRQKGEIERQVTHLVRVKEGKHGEKKAGWEWQRLSKKEKHSERDKRKESLSYCLHAVYQKRP